MEHAFVGVVLRVLKQMVCKKMTIGADVAHPSVLQGFIVI
jgi:hypothetical protein